MKIAMVVLALSLVVSAAAKGRRTVHVKELTTKSGKVVKAHDRTAPNKNKSDNWSTKGNVNPETGKKGTQNPDRKAK